MEREGLYIVITCYNESSAIIRLLNETSAILEKINEPVTLVVVDDGSDDETPRLLLNFQPGAPNVAFRILRLEFNSGHQTAIEQGILFADANYAKHVIIMDGDGEDDPSAIPELMKLRSFDIVQVLRGKREEGAAFRLANGIYKELFLLLTGKRMNMGNYCMISEKVIRIIRSRSYVHLAAFLAKLNLSSTTVMFDRRQRYSGKSKMSFSSLVHHAFRSFIEYAEELVMLFLRMALVLLVLFVITMGYILYLKLFTDKAILGWASTLGIGLMTSALICIGFFTIGVLMLNQSHHKGKHPPLPVYKIVR